MADPERCPRCKRATLVDATLEVDGRRMPRKYCNGCHETFMPQEVFLRMLDKEMEQLEHEIADFGRDLRESDEQVEIDANPG